MAVLIEIAVAAAGLLLAALIVWMLHVARRIVPGVAHFLDDWAGQPERKGVAARPGVMARLQSMEKIIIEVRSETSSNAGRSMNDLLHQTAADLAALRRRVEFFEHKREEREDS